MSTHIQRPVLSPYSAHALFDLVNDAKRYSEFLPWCSASQVLEESENLMHVELTVAKGNLSQRFTIRNMLVPGASVEMNPENGPFTELHGVWQFKVLGEKACRITLDLTFDYVGLLVRATLGPLLIQAANTMVDVLRQHAKQLYG